MKQTTVKVEGMRCGMCEAHVCDTIRKNFDVKKVTASHAENQVVIISEQSLDAEKLVDVISKEGYGVGDIETEDYQKKGLFSFLKH